MMIGVSKSKESEIKQSTNNTNSSPSHSLKKKKKNKPKHRKPKVEGKSGEVVPVIKIPTSKTEASTNWKLLLSKKSTKVAQKKKDFQEKPKLQYLRRDVKKHKRELMDGKINEKKGKDDASISVGTIALAQATQEKLHLGRDKAVFPKLVGLNSLGCFDYTHYGHLRTTLLAEHEFITKPTPTVAIDCEMVGVGPLKEDALARVSIVNEFGYCLYDKFVKPKLEVTDYRTEFSGVREEDLKNAEDLRKVLKEVADLIKGRTLVGHSLKSDLEVLLLKHPKTKIRDTAFYYRKKFKRLKTPSLKGLVKEHLKVEIQKGEHNSITDAQAAMKLYLIMRDDWESSYSDKYNYRLNKYWLKREYRKAFQAMGFTQGSLKHSSLCSIRLNLLCDKVTTIEFKLDIVKKQLKDLAGNETTAASISYPGRQYLINPIWRRSPKNWTFTYHYESILNHIFKIADIDTVKQARLVCKGWNMKATPILGMRTWVDLHTWEKRHDCESEPYPLDQLYQMLDKAVAGITPFRNFSLTFLSLDQHELETQVILREFGTNLNALSFDSPKPSVIKQIIEVWCPNLEKLSMGCTDPVNSENDFTIDAVTKLKTLEVFKARTYYLDSTIHAQIAIQIVRCSPQLSTLIVGDSNVCSILIPGIRQCMDITRNLVKMDVDLTELDGNEGSSSSPEILFDNFYLPKVAKLSVRYKCESMMPLLKKIASTVDTLTLGLPIGDYFDDEDTNDEGDHGIFPSENCPDMDALKIFKLKGFLPSDSSLSSLELKRMKNLQVLYINLDEGDLDTVLLKSDICDPVVDLKKLTIVGSISCVLSFQILVTLFPNLIKLTIGLAKKFQSAEYSFSDCLKDGLSKLVTLKNLTSLSLFFDFYQCGSVDCVIGKLSELKDLADLELGNLDTSRNIVTGFYTGLQQLQHLSWIKFVNIVIVLNEAQKIVDHLRSKGTHWEVAESVRRRCDI